MRKRFLLSIALVALAGMIPVYDVSADDWSPAAAFSDEFATTTLSTKWTFVNPAPNPAGQSWSLAAVPGYLTMTTTGPTDLWMSTNTCPKNLNPGKAIAEIKKLIAARSL